MAFRVALFNLHQGYKRWDERRELVVDQLAELHPDIWALNEVSVPLDSARWLQKAVRERLGLTYTLLQQSKVNSLSWEEGQGLMTLFPVIEAANLDYRSRDRVAQVARLLIEGRWVDIYVTHLHHVRGEDGLRQYQVQQLLTWMQSRNDVEARIVCGDFNDTPDAPSVQLMMAAFRPVQTEPTVPTPLQMLEEDTDPLGSGSREVELFSRCVDYIWVSGPMSVMAAGRCFNQPSKQDALLWPSDHVGVWADLAFAKETEKQEHKGD